MTFENSVIDELNRIATEATTSCVVCEAYADTVVTYVRTTDLWLLWGFRGN